MTTQHDEYNSFTYQEAAFFVGLQLVFSCKVTRCNHRLTKPVKYKKGQRAYVHSLQDSGDGCMLDIRRFGTAKKIGIFDRDEFFDYFCYAPFFEDSTNRT